MGDWQIKDPATHYPVEIGMVVTGLATPLLSMPQSGTATYGYTSGAGGLNSVFGYEYNNSNSLAYVSGSSATPISAVYGNVTMSVDFARGAISGQFLNMMSIVNHLAAYWNNVRFQASISGNTFSGSTVATIPQSTGTGRFPNPSSTGSVNGLFYGPNADEVGATWTITDGAVKAVGVFGATKQASDRRLKCDIQPVATRADGLRLYTFRYIGDERLFTGVMAQDLLDDPRFAPAVHARAGGLMVVDYAALGLEVEDAEAMHEAGLAAIAIYEARAAA